jgi:mRNA interferase YafQ
MRSIETTAAFDRAFKKVKKKHYDMNEFKSLVLLLANGKEIPAKYKDHALRGNWEGTRELHITWKPDWLLIYRLSETVLSLIHTGSHDELFK